jgi:hypothetical protein
MDDSHLYYGLGNNLRYVAASLPDCSPLARCIEYQKPAASTSGAFQPRSTTGGVLRSPIRRHALAPIEAAILLSGPSFLIAPCLEVGCRSVRQKDPPRGLEIGAGLLKGRCRTTGVFTGSAARIEAARPTPLVDINRHAGADYCDRSHMHVAIIDVPAIGSFGISAAGEPGHAPLKRSRTARTMGYRLGIEGSRGT